MWTPRRGCELPDAPQNQGPWLLTLQELSFQHSRSFPPNPAICTSLFCKLTS